MRKKSVLLPVFLAVCLVAYGQEYEELDYEPTDVAVQVENENEGENGNGILAGIEPRPNWFQQARSRGTIDVTLDVMFNVVEYDSFTFSDQEIRAGGIVNYSYLQVGPLDGNWFTEDSVIRFSYTSENFGGSMVLRPADFGTPPWRAWVNIGPMFRVSAGNDIESIYADPQDADPGLRVYTGDPGRTGWDGYLNPDNITQDSGFLLEGFFGPVTAALTGVVLETDRRVEVVTDGLNQFISENRNLRFGGRIGSEIGNWGRINASYIISYERQGGSFHVREAELVPSIARAEIYRHHFGVFASLTPLENLGVTIGYGGVRTGLLDRFYDIALGTRQETIQPIIMQNALMLHARWADVIPGLTLRTDHNYTFWMDKNLASLGAISGWIDKGPESVTRFPNSPDVAHSVLWNGIGVSYRLTNMIGLELYVRNLHRRTFAQGTTDGNIGADGEEFILGRNEFFVEPKLVINLTPFMRVDLAVAIITTTTTASADLNLRGRNLFRPYEGSPNRRLETRDSVLQIQVPIGLIMQF